MLLVGCQASTKAIGEVTKTADLSKIVGIYYLANDVSTDETKSFTNLSAKLKTKISSSHPNWKVNIYDITTKLPFEIDDLLKLNKDFAVTLGENTLLKILASRSKVPIFSLNTPRVTLDRMRKIYADLNIQLSGIYREQPFPNQLALAKAIRPDYENIYVLLGRLSRFHLNDYKNDVALLEYNLKYRILENQDSTAAYFSGMLPELGFLTLLDNSQQFELGNIELLLPVSFQLDIPMIGNRLIHGNIGALASIYSGQNELVEETNQIIEQYFTHNKYQDPKYLKNFSVFVNQQIAQSFNYPNLDEKQLKLIINKNFSQ
jgi:hypothetical protein